MGSSPAGSTISTGHNEKIEQTMEQSNTVPFEAGKFYRVQVFPSYGDPGVKVAARCSKAGKRSVVFDYIVKTGGERKITSVHRSVSALCDGSSDAFVSYKYSGISSTNSVKDACEMPKVWEAFVGNGTRGNEK